MKGKGSAGGRLLMAAGLVLVLGAAALTGYNLWDEQRAGQVTDRVMEHISRQPVPEAPKAESPYEVALPDYLVAPGMEMPEMAVDGRGYIGVLTLPTLGLELPVLSELTDDNLKQGPCRYKGSAYLDDLIIGGHNYRTHFGSLRKLRPGDRVDFTDADGNLFHYEVVELEQLEDTDVREMQTGDWELTLFTCTTSGQSRLAARCKTLVY